MKQFDVCFIGWRNESIYRFGIAPNKLPEYMMSAKPIVHSYSGSFDSVIKAGAGLSVPSENPKAIAEAVLKLKAMSPKERLKMGKNGRAYALEHHDYAKLAQKLAQVLS